MELQNLKKIFDPTKIAVLSLKEGSKKTCLNDIVYIEARRNISIIYFSNNAAGIPVSRSIGYFEKTLP